MSTSTKQLSGLRDLVMAAGYPAIVVGVNPPPSALSPVMAAKLVLVACARPTVMARG